MCVCGGGGGVVGLWGCGDHGLIITNRNDFQRSNTRDTSSNSAGNVNMQAAYWLEL